jgi:prepilin-type N-terminal cleavage/methylation domain-containing protein
MGERPNGLPATRQHRNPNAGFTLVELLVATIILSLVMSGVYMAFSSSIRLWRLGEANLHTYQDARTSFGIMTRELNGILPGAARFIQGDDKEIQFITLAPPMDVEADEGERLLLVTYRLVRRYPRDESVLMREERVVESPLGIARPDEDTGELDLSALDLGRKRKFELAGGAAAFDLSYFWGLPAAEDTGIVPAAAQQAAAPVPLNFVHVEEHEMGWGMPHAIGISLTLRDPNADSGETTFTTRLTFRNTSTPPEEFMDTNGLSTGTGLGLPPGGLGP